VSQKYLEFVVDSLFNRGNFIPLERLNGYVTANLGKLMYTSYYAYDKSVLDYVKSMNSLSGYRGNRYHNKTILDIDGESTDLQTITEVTIDIVKYLSHYHEIEERNIQVWFSGGKGYHIHMPNVFTFEDSESLSFDTVSTFKSFFNKWNDYVDTAPLAPAGLIRAPYSTHKSGLHKIPISHKQLFDIGNSASAQSYLHEIAGENYMEQRVTIPMNNIDDGTLSNEVVEGEVQSNWHQMNDYDNPSSVVTCMQKLFLRGPVAGRRHKDILRIISAWRRHGIIASMSRLMVLAWLDIPDNSKEAQEFTRIVENVYKGEYSYGCKDEVMTEFCDSNCIFYKNKDFVLEVNNAANMTKNLAEYIQKVDYSGINLSQIYKHEGNYKFVPGEIMVVTGDTGAGKSAFVQDLLCKIKQKTLYLNLEMHESLVYRRFLQNIHNKTKDEIINMVRNGQLFNNDLDFIDMLSVSPEITSMSRIISQKDYKYVVVDTSDGIQADKAGNNEYVKLGMIVETFRELAQNKDIQVILIHHLKKRDDPRALIQLNDLSGNRANVTKMDHVFALEGTEEYKTLRSLKNRDQGKLNIQLKFNYNVFRFEPRQPHANA
jgi:hypothetical protein